MKLLGRAGSPGPAAQAGLKSSMWLPLAWPRAAGMSKELNICTFSVFYHKLGWLHFIL